MTPTIYYCYDAYCGWCFGFSTVIFRIYEEYKDRLFFETLSGNMIPNEYAQPIGKMAGYINQAYKVVEERTGIRFGEDYLWHIRNPDLSDWVPSSEKPAIAMVVFKEYYPEKSVEFAKDLQTALHVEGRDLTDDEAYRHLLAKYNIPAADFYRKLHSEESKHAAYMEFSMVKQLQVTGFPAVFMQVSETKFYLLSRGFTEYESLKTTIDKVLKEREADVSS
ncbi:DsbA family protein [Pollutibacter soli]|uniref:DsbA family protein n=1 Tax=Pollutibacter soli TaxID=3034157 RepID=UPI0030139617